MSSSWFNNQQKALEVNLQGVWSRAVPVFDDERLVSCAGLVPVMGLAEQTGLAELIADKVVFRDSTVASAGVNPAGKLSSIIAGMVAGADCIDDLDLLRSGGMGRLFTDVYAPATLGQHLREFTHGHTLQLGSVLRAHLPILVQSTGLLPGISEQVFIDIDSLLRPVFGHAKQGASYGHTKIAGKQVLRKGLSPLATILSTTDGAPVIAGVRLRAGKAGSGRGAASMVSDAITVARAAGAAGEVLVRGDSAYGHSTVVRACRRADARFSLVLVKNRAVTAAIAAIPDDAWVPVHYPGAVPDPETGELISDAEVAEIAAFTAFGSTPHPVTARLIVRRVRDRARLDELFPVWRHHPFLTDSTQPAPVADIIHRRHAIIETTFADLIDGPLAHLPSVISSPVEGAHHVRDEGCVVSEARRGCDYLPLSIRQRRGPQCEFTVWSCPVLASSPGRCSETIMGRSSRSNGSSAICRRSSGHRTRSRRMRMI